MAGAVRLALAALVLALLAASGCAIAQRADRFELEGRITFSLSSAITWLPQVVIETSIRMEDSAHASTVSARDRRGLSLDRGLL